MPSTNPHSHIHTSSRFIGPRWPVSAGVVSINVESLSGGSSPPERGSCSTARLILFFLWLLGPGWRMNPWTRPQKPRGEKKSSNLIHRSASSLECPGEVFWGKRIQLQSCQGLHVRARGYLGRDIALPRGQMRRTEEGGGVSPPKTAFTIFKYPKEYCCWLQTCTRTLAHPLTT